MEIGQFNTSGSATGNLFGDIQAIVSGSPITNIAGKITVDKIKEQLYSYYDLGWKIIPMFGMNRGKCQCGKADCDKPGKQT